MLLPSCPSSAKYDASSFSSVCRGACRSSGTLRYRYSRFPEQALSQGHSQQTDSSKQPFANTSGPPTSSITILPTSSPPSRIGLMAPNAKASNLYRKRPVERARRMVDRRYHHHIAASLRYHDVEGGAAAPVIGAAVIVIAGLVAVAVLFRGRGNLPYAVVFLRALAAIFVAGGQASGPIAVAPSAAAIFVISGLIAGYRRRGYAPGSITG